MANPVAIPAAIPFHEAIPRYHQIAQLLRQRAATGELGAITEQTLCAEFGVSRTTIRQALGLLKRDGVLKARRGVGTRLVEVERPALAYRRYSGDPLHAALGSRPNLVSLTKEPAPAEVAKFLRLAEGQPALKLVRAHSLDDAPLSLVISYMSGAFANVITRQVLRTRIVHEVLLEQCGLFQKKSTHSIRVARADGFVASHLGIALADPVMHIRSRGFLEDGAPIRWTDNYFREDRYEYTAEMTWKKPK